MRPYGASTAAGQEWLGDVPKHWHRATVRAITSPFTEKGRPDLPLLSVYRDYGVVQRTAEDENYNVIPEDLTNYKVVRPGTLVLNKMKTWQGSLGVSDFEGIVSPAYITCHLRGGHNPRFIHHLFRCRPYVFAWKRISYGVRCDQWDMRYADFKQTPVFLPPRREQDAIVAFLEAKERDIQTFIANKRRTIELLKEQKTALINRAVTRGLNPKAPLKPSGIPWIGETPKHWTLKKLKFCVPAITVGIVVTPAKYYEPEGIPCLRSLNISSGKICGDEMVFISSSSNDLHSKSKIYEGDVVVVRTGRTGIAAIVTKEYDGANCIDLLIVRRSSRLLPEYLLRFLNSWTASIQVLLDSVGAIQSHYNTATLAEMLVPLPPIEEQQQIISQIAGASAEAEVAIRTAEREIALMDEYRTALIAAAVTGKIDVRPAARELPAVSDGEAGAPEASEDEVAEMGEASEPEETDHAHD